MVNIKLLKINMIINGKYKKTNKRYDLNSFDINGKHEDTNEIYDPNGFNINGKHKNTNDKYDPNGFYIYYTHKDTDDIYAPNGFNINGRHKDTLDIYDTNGFDINGKHKVTSIFLDKKSINWLKDKDEFLKLYNEIIKNGEFIEKIGKKSISSYLFKDFLEDILNGKIRDNKIENYIIKINNIEKDLNELKKSENINKLKNYIKKIKNSVYGKNKDRIRTDQARSFKDQKGKGYVDLTIFLSKMYTNDSSKELISNIKQLINNLYNNEQITKQVYNNLIKAITYKNDS